MPPLAVTVTCVIRGPVIIGNNTIVRNSYIGPYTSIGNEVEIYNTEIEHSVVFDYVDINCSTRIVDSLIGQNATASIRQCWTDGIVYGEQDVGGALLDDAAAGQDEDAIRPLDGGEAVRDHQAGAVREQRLERGLDRVSLANDNRPG